MSSERSRRWTTAAVIAAVLATVGAALTAAHTSSGARAPQGARAAGARPADAFSWLRPAPAPHAWSSATIASGGATLFYPAGWKPIPGDGGTVTAAVRDSRGAYRGYLNVTPRQGDEQLHGWAAFRTGRNRGEGDAQVHLLSAVENVRLGRTHASCVIDDYLSRVGAHAYRELACLIVGHRFANVFVGATPVSDWPTLGASIELAASALRER